MNMARSRGPFIAWKKLSTCSSFKCRGSGRDILSAWFFRTGLTMSKTPLIPQVVIELPDAVQMAVDGLGLQSSPHELVDVVRDLGVGHTLDRHVEPEHKATDRAQVALNRVGRAVAPLQIAPPADDRIPHRRSLSRLQTWP